MSLPRTLVLVVLGKEAIDFADITTNERQFIEGSIIIPSRGQEVYGLSFIHDDRNRNQEIIWEGSAGGVNFDPEINADSGESSDFLSLAGFTPSQIQFLSRQVSRTVMVSATLRSKGQAHTITRDVSVSRNTAFSLFTLNRTYTNDEDIDVDLYDVELDLVVDEVDLVVHSNNVVDFTDDNDADFVEGILARSGAPEVEIPVGAIVSNAVCQGSGTYQFANYFVSDFDSLQARGVAAGIPGLLTVDAMADGLRERTQDAADPLNRTQSRWFLNTDSVLSVTLGELELIFLRYIRLQEEGEEGCLRWVVSRVLRSMSSLKSVSLISRIDIVPMIRNLTLYLYAFAMMIRLIEIGIIRPAQVWQAVLQGFFTIEASRDSENYTQIANIGDVTDPDVTAAANFSLNPNTIYNAYLSRANILAGFG